MSGTLAAFVIWLMSASSGAAEPSTPARVTALKVEPAAAVLASPDHSVQFLVTATRSDGTETDVTRAVQYTPVEPAVATISSAGRVLPQANGTSEIRITFGDAAGGESLSVAAQVTVEQFDGTRPLNFTNDILPRLNKHGCNSGSCHGKGSGQNGFKLSLFGFDPEFDYAALVQEGLGRRISAAAPDDSLMLQKATGQIAHGGGARFDPQSESYRLLRKWIAQGAGWGADDDPTLLRIDVLPAERLLDGDGTQQLQVVAHYSDGTRRDVSQVAEYVSQHPTLLKVDSDGLAHMQGDAGEGTVMVRYMGIVGVARLTVPYRRSLAPEAYAAFRPKNFVDELVLKKWQKLGLAPSPPATDAEFIRRAYLDTLGILPTPQEVRDFLADQAADKRDALVDRVLAREEYAAFWAARWGDLLRNRQGDGSFKESTTKFANWIRQAFADNVPYDRFARELVTVTGKLEDHPQMDWYRQLNSNQNRVEDISQVFLGRRVSCANCHNHPFERISQNDYWQFAAFFARLDAMPYGPVKTVGIKDEGTVTNPRTNKPMTAKPFGGPEFPEFAKGEDPRVKLMDWMTDKENPYFARAIANRLWAHYLDRGLVEAVDDMRATNPPSNPELLDALAQELVAHQFDLKYLMRTIMKSQVYALSAQPHSDNRADLQNYARHYPRRLSAQVLLDALCSATGVPEKFKEFPDAKRAVELPNESANSDFLDIFGRSKRETPCQCEARDDPNLPQVLYLLFSPELHEKLANSEGTVARLLKAEKTTPEIVEELFLLTVSRLPTADEMQQATAAIDAAPKRPQGVEDLLWTLLNSKEFLFSH